MEPYFILYEVLLVHICLKLTKSIGMRKIYQSFKQANDQMDAGLQKHQNITKSALFQFQKWHTCHKLWTEICEIWQFFKGDLIKFCEIYAKITFELTQNNQNAAFI